MIRADFKQGMESMSEFKMNTVTENYRVVYAPATVISLWGTGMLFSVTDLIRNLHYDSMPCWSWRVTILSLLRISCQYSKEFPQLKNYTIDVHVGQLAQFKHHGRLKMIPLLFGQKSTRFLVFAWVASDLRISMLDRLELLDRLEFCRAVF